MRQFIYGQDDCEECDDWEYKTHNSNLICVSNAFQCAKATDFPLLFTYRPEDFIKMPDGSYEHKDNDTFKEEK